MQAARFILLNQTFWLSTERCIFWEEQKSLIVSDLHFGKTGHFRKSGIAVPQKVYKEDIQRLFSIVQHFNTERLIVVGDLFHSSENKELEYFRQWRNDFPHLHICLVKGNHDILQKEWYTDLNIIVAEKILKLGKICFIHDINDCNDDMDVDYFISGHVHPCVKLTGIAKQSISLPCFYFSAKFGILPAFSKFTGGKAIDPLPADDVFAIIPANTSQNQVGTIIKL